jgi:two-component system KDP operon response regulator KdpE
MIDPTVLVIEDELQIRHAVRRALTALPATTMEAATGTLGVDLAVTCQPDAIILDLGLPDMIGIEVCREIRQWSSVPLLVLSARCLESEKVALLNAGADDYMTKPFDSEELIARMRAHLRRSEAERAHVVAHIGAHVVTSVVQIGGLRIDLSGHTATRDGTLVRLTRLEWNLLRTFVTHNGRTLTHQQLFNAVWRCSYGNAQQYLRVHIANLRRKIEVNPAAPELIVTEAGVGYRFALDVPCEYTSTSAATNVD